MISTFSARLRTCPSEIWKTDTICIRPILDDDDLWFAAVECRLKPGQEDFVNPAGFSIGRAYLHPENNLPCVICKKDGTRIGYIVLRKWFDAAIDAASWSYYLDAAYQGMGLGRQAAALAIRILQAAGFSKIRLATEADNIKAQKLYASVGFVRLDEMDGDDLVFGIS